MSDDLLDKKISIGAELTSSGLSVNAKSRAASAFDRLLGNVIDFVNIPVERKNVEARTKMDSERRLVEAVRDHALERMKADREFADRAVENYIRTLGSRQQNKDEVARHALEDLRRDHATSDDADPDLDPLFLDKIERHAEDASTDPLREKWGRVLAAEIRRPGTITPRVMRIIDEIDSVTARLFETFCLSRLHNVIPVCLHGELTFADTTKLVTAGLLVDPGGLGQVRRYSEVTTSSGEKLQFVNWGRAAVGVDPAVTPVQSTNRRLAAIQRDTTGALSVPAYILTDEGYAVSQILADEESAAFERYLECMRSVLPSAPLVIFRHNGDRFEQVKILESDKSP